jgi:hypothetical protein
METIESLTRLPSFYHLNQKRIGFLVDPIAPLGNQIFIPELCVRGRPPLLQQCYLSGHFGGAKAPVREPGCVFGKQRRLGRFGRQPGGFQVVLGQAGRPETEPFVSSLVFRKRCHAPLVFRPRHGLTGNGTDWP